MTAVEQRTYRITFPEGYCTVAVDTCVFFSATDEEGADTTGGLWPLSPMPPMPNDPPDALAPIRDLVYRVISLATPLPCQPLAHLHPLPHDRWMSFGVVSRPTNSPNLDLDLAALSPLLHSDVEIRIVGRRAELFGDLSVYTAEDLAPFDVIRFPDGWTVAEVG